MALNEIYAVANSLVFPVADTVVSGDLVQVGQIVGIAEHDAKAGEDGNTYATLKLTGAFKLETEDTISVGAKVYVTSLGVVTSTSTSNKLIGHAIKAGTGYVVVRLHQN
jgi:predicted RecA/RadA family phage recombinase